MNNGNDKFGQGQSEDQGGSSTGKIGTRPGENLKNWDYSLGDKPDDFIEGQGYVHQSGAMGGKSAP